MGNNRKIIIMVDDNITNLNVARNTLIDKYDIFTVPSGKKLFQILNKIKPDLILLDVDMPEMSGYEVIRILKDRADTAHIPVIFLTAKIDTEDEIQGLSLGAVDYITKPFSPPLLLKRIEVHLLVEAQKKDLEAYNNNLEQMVKKKTKAIFELQNAVLKTVAELVEFRDDVTGCHIERTQNYLRVLVEILLEQDIYYPEISSWDSNFFILSAQLHDVGKIAIKDSILLKPGKLTLAEFEEMKKHTLIGAQIIKKIEESTQENIFLKHAEILAASHHEKWDGSGYPFGLKGDNIPLQGRLMAIVDVYDALTNDRPYKKAFSHDEAIKIIRSECGTHFDPQLASAFLKHEKKFKNIIFLDGLMPDMSQEELEAAYELQLTISKTLENIAGYNEGGGMGYRHVGKSRKYIKVLINALLNHDNYKDAVSTWDMDLLMLSAQLHDVGKITVSSDILQKPAQLTEEEFAEIKKHTNTGLMLIKHAGAEIEDNDFFEYAQAFIGSHHEKWDGSGYPLGLKGEEIPLQGRLMALVDVYDALTSIRSYKKVSSHEDALKIIKSESGTRFDPQLVQILLEHEKEFQDIHHMGREAD